MAALRSLFRATHQLVNEMYAHPEAELAHGVIDLHRELTQAAQTLDSFEDRVLVGSLEAHSSLHHLLGELRHAVPGDKPLRDSAEPPSFLNRADRLWERLVWRASVGSTTWRLITFQETCSLREFARESAAREQELARQGIVLAVSCLTPEGDTREWQWHCLREATG